MFTLNRIALPAINAFFITTCLLYLMFLLIKSDHPDLVERRVFPPVEWTPVKEDTTPEFGIVKPLEPVEPEERPAVPEIDEQIIVDIKGDTSGGSYQPPRIRNLNPVFDNSQLVLALGFPPPYPNSAITRGIEGYAVVGFSVDAAGTVFDAFIIESEPNSTFDRSALKAIKKFKYKARMVDGKPVSTDGQRYMFTYKIDS